LARCAGIVQANAIDSAAVTIYCPWNLPPAVRTPAPLES
jgi:hypothetical protein